MRPPCTAAKEATLCALVAACLFGARPSAAQTPPVASASPPSTPAVPAASQTPPPPSAGPIVLTWSAPEGCPDQAAVVARIERLLGGPPRASDRRLDARAEVEAIPRGFRLEIDLATGDFESKRVLQGALCESVADAAALVIALAFDPDAVAAQEARQAESAAPADTASPPPAPPADSTAPPAAPPADSTAPPPPPPPGADSVVRIPVPLRPRPPLPVPAPSFPFTFGVFAQLAGDAGSLPSVAPGLRAGLSLGIGAFRIEPAFEAWPSSRSAVPDRPTTGAELRLLAFTLGACRRLWPWTSPSERGIPGVLGCLGFEIGEMHGAGFGVATPRSAGFLWTAPRAELRAELPLATWLSLTFDLGLAVPLDRRQFVLTLGAARTVLHQPSAVAGRASAGLSVRF